MKSIRIILDGGIIQDILHIPPGTTIEVYDYDTRDSDPNDPKLSVAEDGKKVYATTWKGAALKREKTRRLFPETFAKIKRAKHEGLQAETVWLTLQNGVKNSGMAPSGQAASLAEYQEYLIEVYGKRATVFLRKAAK